MFDMKKEISIYLLYRRSALNNKKSDLLYAKFTFQKMQRLSQTPNHVQILLIGIGLESRFLNLGTHNI